jgi:hypothetical protein
MAYVPVSFVSMAQSEPSDLAGQSILWSAEVCLLGLSETDRIQYVLGSYDSGKVRYSLQEIQQWQDFALGGQSPGSVLVVTFADICMDFGEEVQHSPRLKVWRLPDGSTRAAREGSLGFDAHHSAPESEQSLASDRVVAKLREMVAKLDFSPLD